MNKIVFFGTEDFSAPSLEALIKSGYDIACVVTKPDTIRGRGHKMDSPMVAKIAKKSDIPVLQPDKLSEIKDYLLELKAQVGVLVSYGKIIPKSIIDSFPSGIINVHPSLLPKYRGPSPIESAILNGDSETGVTIMSLIKDMDTGPIYYQEVISLNGDETRPELYDKFSILGAELLIKTLPDILSGTLKPEVQNEPEATYCSLIDRVKDGHIDPTVMTATECHNRVKAYLGWPKTRLDFLGNELVITKTRVLQDFEGESWPDVVICKDDTALQIVELITPSGKQTKTADYLRGLKS